MKSMSPSSPSGRVARRPPLFVPRRTALRSFSALAALASAGALTGCGLAPSDKKRDDALAKIEWLPSEVDTESVSLDEARSAAATASCSTVGATMISTRLDEESDRNALSCPIGIALILALLHAGADAVGEGLNPALGLDAAADARTRDSTWNAVQQALQRFDIEDVQQLRDFDPDAIPETPLLHVANNILLVKEDTVVSQRYLDDAKRWYAAEVGRAPNDDAKAALDAWASLHTGGLIKKSGIDVTPGMRLVLQNALLFAARWAAPFTAEHTAKGSPFTLSDGSASTADLMTGTGTYALAQGQGWRALRLPYTAGATTSGAPVPAPSGSGTTDSGELVMDVILPDDVVSPADMPPSTWGEATAALTSARARPQAAEARPGVRSHGHQARPAVAGREDADAGSHLPGPRHRPGRAAGAPDRGRGGHRRRRPHRGRGRRSAGRRREQTRRVRRRPPLRPAHRGPGLGGGRDRGGHSQSH